MTHVVQVLSDTNIGGAGKYLINYLKYFNRQAFRVTVILPEGSQLSAYVREMQDVTLLEMPYMADQSYNKRCVAVLKELFTNIKPDILHTHACLSARIAGKRAKVPVVLATRHCIEPLPHGMKALAVSFLNSALCDYYIAVSQAVVQNLLDSGIKSKKIKSVPNGVESVKLFSPDEIAETRARYGVKEDETLFGIFARLEPVKGHKYFIKAARELLKEEPKAKFLIVGTGTLEKALQERVKSYGLEKQVIFTGFVPDTAALLNACDVNVNASESEAMSLSILEAMSLGKVTIATRAGGNGELVQDGTDGFLVNYADSASLALAMARLMRDQKLLIKLSRNAKEKYENNYTAAKMVARLEDIYKEVLTHDC